MNERPTDREILQALDVAIQLVEVMWDLQDNREIDLPEEERRRVSAANEHLPVIRQRLGRYMADHTIGQLLKEEGRPDPGMGTW